MRSLISAVVAPLVLAAAWPSVAAEASHGDADSEYGRDLISVATGLHWSIPTANCIVWANAEGLGVGPAQLGGFHGLSMNINLKPLPQENPHPTTFESGMAELKSSFPTAPAWLLKTLEKNRAAIEAACVQDHPTPFKVYSITRRDVSG